MHGHESGYDCGMENTWSRVGPVSNQLVLSVLHICQTKLGGLRKRCKQFGWLRGEKGKKERKEKKERKKGDKEGKEKEGGNGCTQSSRFFFYLGHSLPRGHSMVMELSPNLGAGSAQFGTNCRWVF